MKTIDKTIHTRFGLVWVRKFAHQKYMLVHLPRGIRLSGAGDYHYRSFPKILRDIAAAESRLD